MLMPTEPATSDSGKETTAPEQPAPEQAAAAPGPEELDLMLRVTPSVAWPILMALVAAVTVALVWSVVSHAPQRAEGTGILLTPLGVADIPAPAEGRVEALKVKPGQTVKAGELVALLSQEDLAARLRQKQFDLEEVREQEDLVRAFHQADAEQRSRMIGTQEENLKVRIRVLEELEKAVGEQTEMQRVLLAKGLGIQEKIVTARIRLKEVQSEAADAQVTLTRLRSDEAQLQSRRARELLDFETKVSALEREIAAIKDEIERKSRVTAPRDGIISEVEVNIGELWRGPMMRMLPLDEGEAGTLVGELYVRAEDGKKIRPGMIVEIIPSTVRVERFGYIYGRVVNVSVIPATRESIMRTLKNSSMVEKLTANGPPFAVTVSLDRAATPSGYRWSTGRGPEFDITNGTLIQGRVVVSTIPIVALAIPEAERVLRRLGL
jgi:NHLM bacteriocin system secretion protein